MAFISKQINNWLLDFDFKTGPFYSCEEQHIYQKSAHNLGLGHPFTIKIGVDDNFVERNETSEFLKHNGVSFINYSWTQYNLSVMGNFLIIPLVLVGGMLDPNLCH